MSQVINKTKKLVSKLVSWFTFDKLVNAIIIAAFALLLVLVWFYVRPIPTVDIKVPVATDKSSYYPGQQVSGIFFGDVYFNGRVEVLREVYCKNYRDVIKTDTGDDIFNGISVAKHLDGGSREIGKLPVDVPVGSNCVIQFANTYRVGTPFGDREITNVYYTQNFSIVSYGRRLQLDCEAAGGKDCDKLNTGNSTSGSDVQTVAPTTQSTNSDAPLFQPAEPTQDATSSTSTTSNNSTMKNVTNDAEDADDSNESGEHENEPYSPPYAKQCTIKVFSLCL